MRWLRLGLLCLLGGLITDTFAAVSSSLSGPGTASSGDSATFLAAITDTGPPTNVINYSSPFYTYVYGQVPYSCGPLGLATCYQQQVVATYTNYYPYVFDKEKINSVQYSFNSGDGRTFSGTVSGQSVDSLTLTHTFSYLTPGSYTPTFSATITATDFVSTQYIDHYNEYQQSYACGFWGLGTCYETISIPVYGWFDKPTYYPVYTIEASTSITVSALAASVPEPESYGMLVVGLGLIGALGRRKRMRAA